MEIDPGRVLGRRLRMDGLGPGAAGQGPNTQLDADGKQAMGKWTWIIQGGNTKVENIVFSGASAPDQNGVGIRQEGGTAPYAGRGWNRPCERMGRPARVTEPAPFGSGEGKG